MGECRYAIAHRRPFAYKLLFYDWNYPNSALYHTCHVSSKNWYFFPSICIYTQRYERVGRIHHTHTPAHTQLRGIKFLITPWNCRVCPWGLGLLSLPSPREIAPYDGLWGTNVLRGLGSGPRDTLQSYIKFWVEWRNFTINDKWLRKQRNDSIIEVHPNSEWQMFWIIGKYRYFWFIIDS